MQKLARFNIIVITDLRDGIGKNGTIPWNSPVDRRFFVLLLALE